MRHSGERRNPVQISVAKPLFKFGGVLLFCVASPRVFTLDSGVRRNDNEREIVVNYNLL